MKIKDMKKVHQIYGEAAVKTACGLSIISVKNITTALPGISITCLTCKRVEKSRRR